TVRKRAVIAAGNFLFDPAGEGGVRGSDEDQAQRGIGGDAAPVRGSNAGGLQVALGRSAGFVETEGRIRAEVDEAAGAFPEIFAGLEVFRSGVIGAHEVFTFVEAHARERAGLQGE